MTTAIGASLVPVADTSMFAEAERVALVGFLAGYRGATREAIVVASRCRPRGQTDQVPRWLPAADGESCTAMASHVDYDDPTAHGEAHRQGDARPPDVDA
jgi:hypothetical protein